MAVAGTVLYIYQAMRKFEEIRIENTNMCLLNCITCPREKMSRKKGRMSYAEFVDICGRISEYIKSPSVKYFDVHGYGEPLVDKEISRKIRYVKDNFPNVKIRMVSTLYVATEILLDELLQSGLNEIVLSHYGASEADYRLIHGARNYYKARHNIEYLVRKNSELGNPLEVIFENLNFSNILTSEQEKTRRYTLQNWQKTLVEYGVKIRDIAQPHNWGSAYHNMNVSPSICSIVSGFRSRVLQVTWNGDVIPCCFDYNADMVFGNLFSVDIETIFSSELYKHFIRCHADNELENFAPCRVCQRCLIQ